MEKETERVTTFYSKFTCLHTQVTCTCMYMCMQCVQELTSSTCRCTNRDILMLTWYLSHDTTNTTPYTTRVAINVCVCGGPSHTMTYITNALYTHSCNTHTHTHQPLILNAACKLAKDTQQHGVTSCQRSITCMYVCTCMLFEVCRGCQKCALHVLYKIII